MAKCHHCSEYAHYGYTTLIACCKHREKGMSNLYAKRCSFDSCDKIPVYGFISDNKRSHCKEHSLEGMINLKGKSCLVDMCKSQASYCLPLEKNPSHCFKHKLEDMINKKKNKKCLIQYCETRPHFGYDLDKIRKYCSKHKLEGMVDLDHYKCLFNSCKKSPIFGFPNENKASFCKNHASQGMIDIVNKRQTCKFESCKKIPIFGLHLDKSPTFCKLHALPNMVDIKHNKCKLCNMTRSRIQDYCAPCFYYLNPEHIKTKRHKTRENTFMYQLKEIYPDIILDKAVAGGCSRKRPDGLIDLYTHSIIIEIDEDQHRGYSCENKRLMQLFTDLGSRPIIFIRLNPDSYISNGKKIKGCFSLSKSLGQLIPNEREISERFNVLLETIDECKSVPDKTVTIVELYFSD